MILKKAIDEDTLLVGLRNGSHKAFEQLYHRYKRLIVGHLLNLFHDEGLAQDIAQDTFIKVWESRAQLDEHKSFKAYLFTIATNNAYNLFRKAGKDEKTRLGLQLALQQAVNQVEEYIFQKEHLELLHSLLSLLPEKQRQVFRMAKIEGYSYAEISEQLHISPNTINTHIKRASSFLREQLLNHPELLLALLVVQSI
ncbi:RNA polymerase sigma factor [Olivibacter sitiensis]|uniref:RNA polymerase sigma factor n=1 Tax=Olivibacter sitiensis TaxID=376470 RepID=UPI000421CA26|nr:RNA polymerase sigma-70 factor [Olivibacter sitiensis]